MLMPLFLKVSQNPEEDLCFYEHNSVVKIPFDAMETPEHEDQPVFCKEDHQEAKFSHVLTKTHMAIKTFDPALKITN